MIAEATAFPQAWCRAFMKPGRAPRSTTSTRIFANYLQVEAGDPQAHEAARDFLALVKSEFFMEQLLGHARRSTMKKWPTTSPLRYADSQALRSCDGAPITAPSPLRSITPSALSVACYGLQICFRVDTRPRPAVGTPTLIARPRLMARSCSSFSQRSIADGLAATSCRNTAAAIGVQTVMMQCRFHGKRRRVARPAKTGMAAAEVDAQNRCRRSALLRRLDRSKSSRHGDWRRQRRQMPHAIVEQARRTGYQGRRHQRFVTLQD